MKTNTPLTFLLTCIASAVVSVSFLLSAQAGASNSDDIVIFRSTQSDRSTSYFQTSPSTPDAKVREGNRRTSYLILNLATGEYMEVPYWTETQTDLDGKRFRAKLYFAEGITFNAAAMFQTGPTDRRNYLLLSLYGVGMGNNFSFSQSGNLVSSHVTSETLEGVMRLQRIRTALGIVECIAPSTIRGARGIETQRSEGGAMNERRVTTGRKTLRLDKRRIREAKDAGASSLGGFQSAVTDYLESKGYVRSF